MHIHKEVVAVMVAQRWSWQWWWQHSGAGMECSDAAGTMVADNVLHRGSDTGGGIGDGMIGKGGDSDGRTKQEVAAMLH